MISKLERFQNGSVILLRPCNLLKVVSNRVLLTSSVAAFFIALERACHTQLLAEAAAANGLRKKFVGETEAAYTKNFCGHGLMYMQFAPEYSMILEETNGAFLL